MESLQQLKASGEEEWGTEDIKTEMVDNDHHNNNRGKAGADITIDRFLQFLTPYANPLSTIRELV